MCHLSQRGSPAHAEVGDHGYEPENWCAEIETESEDESEEPSFLNEETDADVELITDGGDE